MSDLVPSLIELNKGLDLQTPKITAEAGSILDTLNYEQVDFQGQKRIDGFTRYDGSRLSAFDEYYILEFPEALDTPAVGDLLAVDDGLFAVTVDFSNLGGTAVVIINEKLIPDVNDSVYVINPTDGSLGEALVVGSITTGTDWEESADTHYANLITYQKTLRQNVEALPGPVAGLHWFRDRLYAVADVVAVSLDGITPPIYPNDLLDNGFEETKVLDAFILAETRLVFIDSFDAEGLWQEEGRDITRDGASVGTIASGFNFFGSDTEIASFFESRSEQQVIDEDDSSLNFGWRFKDLGWKINYADGVSLYGSLPSLNQNISGLGTQGPTDTSGNNGKPTVLTQNASISGKPAQVEGWKSSQTPTSYSLDVDNITTVDDVTIYADAYVSWDGTTGVVSSPGLTTSNLEARAANTTVNVEITP